MCEKHGEHSIELDCPPGNPRPNDLIQGVIKGTGLEAEPASTFFGHSWWGFSQIDCEAWDKIQAITKPRITALYHAGRIRFGSW